MNTPELPIKMRFTGKIQTWTRKTLHVKLKLGLFNHFNVPNRKLRKLQYFLTEKIECKLIRNVCERNFVLMRQCVVTFSCLCTVRVAPKSNNIGR